jgi:hypothetical protein
MRRIWLGGAGVALVVAAVACSSSTTAPTPGPGFDLTGRWTGTVGAGSGGGRALRVVWTATQTGHSVTGAATLTTSPAVTDITIPGTLNGSVAENGVLLTFTAPRGSVPGSATCTVSGLGSATTASGTIVGRLPVTFSGCDGLNLQAPSSDQLTLSKQ